MTESRRLKQLLRRALEHLDPGPRAAAMSREGQGYDHDDFKRHDRTTLAMLVLDIQQALRPEVPDAR